MSRFLATSKLWSLFFCACKAGVKTMASKAIMNIFLISVLLISI